jgi:CARDB
MKLTTLFITLALMLGFATVSSGDRQMSPAQLKLKYVPAAGKANLVVRSAGWSREFCNSVCPQINADLKINKVNCGFKVRVVNIGNKSTGNFAVQLLYTHWNGTSTLQKVKWVSSLGPKGASNSYKDINFGDIGYFRSNKPFIVKVDSTNRIPESNESDNTKTVNP